jgi:hypothetical protein
MPTRSQPREENLFLDKGPGSEPASLVVLKYRLTNINTEKQQGALPFLLRPTHISTEDLS